MVVEQKLSVAKAAKRLEAAGFDGDYSPVKAFVRAWRVEGGQAKAMPTSRYASNWAKPSSSI